MEYKVEELLPVVTRLTEKYTSKESTSVPHETARQLMEAVIYCIEENENGEGALIMTEAKMPAAQIMYERGFEILTRKVHETKAIYDDIIQSFESYRLENYDETIRKGMPAFFLRYDAKFNPQDHLLTLDYPLLKEKPRLCGIDLIREYLKGIQKEKAFLDCFNRAVIIRILDRTVPEYETLYLNNICDVVLFEALFCMIAEKPLWDLRMNDEDYDAVRFYFDGDEREKIETKTVRLIRMLMGHLGLAADYFEPAAKDYAFRISQRMQRKK